MLFFPGRTYLKVAAAISFYRLFNGFGADVCERRVSKCAVGQRDEQSSEREKTVTQLDSVGKRAMIASHIIVG